MRFLICAALLGLAACQTPPPSSDMGNSVPHAMAGQTTADATELGALLNAERAARGLQPVRENALLTRSAMGHARDMEVNGFFSHYSASGATFGDRARAEGYRCPRAENIAEGYPTVQIVHEEWMASSKHRQNNLLPDVTEFGLGHVGDSWVLVFGRGC